MGYAGHGAEGNMFGVALRKYSVTLCFVVMFALVAASMILPQSAQALSWTQVVGDGFGSANNDTIVDIVEFSGQLYASVGNPVDGFGIYRSTDGVTWTPVATGGINNPIFDVARLAVNGSALYASVAQTTGPVQFQVWKTTNGTTWTQVGTDGFGDATNFWAGALYEWQGNIYVGTWNPATGVEIWQLTLSDIVTQVNVDGFGTGNANSGMMQFGEFDGYLYAGTDNIAGAQIWRTNNGTVWEQVGGDGIGDATNTRISSFFVFGGYFYAGTTNVAGCQLWRSQNGTAWSVVDNTGFGDADNIWVGPNAAVVNGVVYVGLRNGVDGARLLYSTDGTTWNQEGTDGFGNANNFAFYALTYNGFLYLGVSTGGNNGAEIWRTGDLDPLVITTESLPDGTKNSEYSQTIETENGTSPLTWSVTGSLPEGLTLDVNEGIVSGTPTQTGDFIVTVSVTDVGTPQQLASREYTLKINDVAEVLPETGKNNKLINSWLNLN